MDNPIIDRLKQEITAVEEEISGCGEQIVIAKSNISKTGRLAKRLQDLVDFDKSFGQSSLAFWTSSSFQDIVESHRDTLEKQQDFWKLKLNTYRKDLKDAALKFKKFNEYLELVEVEEEAKEVAEEVAEEEELGVRCLR